MTTAAESSITTLRPPWIYLAQAAWMAITILTIVFFTIGSIDAFRQPLPSCLVEDTRTACYPHIFSQEDGQIASAMGWSEPLLFAILFATSILARFGFLGVGVFVFWRKRDDWLTLMMSAMLVMVLLEGVYSGPGKEPVVVQVLWGIAFLIYIPLWFIFPNGRHEPRWTRWISVPLAVGVAITYFFDVWLNWLYVSLLIVSITLSIYAMVYRYLHAARMPERQQIKWVAIGMVILSIVVIFNNVGGLSYPASQPSPQRLEFLLANSLLYVACYWSFAICVGIAILRHRLWDIDIVFNRVLVYGVLSAFVIVAYIVIVGGLGVLFQSAGNFFVSLVATGLIAVIFQPAKEKLQRAINRLMYGQRDEPYSVLSSLSQNLESTLDPSAILPTIAETVAKALKLPYAAILLCDGSSVELAVEYGVPPAAPPLALPLNYQHQLIGELHVAPRSPDESFTPAEHHLLADIAHQAGVAAHNVILTTELQRARERLVTAREEERRRLRRDLHDGLGPKLAGQALILEAVRDSLVPGSHNRELVDHLITDSQIIVSEIRKLVHGLRPPALDDYGLVDAIRMLAVQCESNKLRVSVTAPDPTPPLPAAVEVAAYRIAQEALTNVVRHAQAQTCTVSLAIDRNLDVAIQDDGVGLPPDRRAGVGLSSMRERAEEIGGTCTVQAEVDGGTRVLAQLPIHREI